MGFWNQDHPLSKEFSRLWDEYVPMSGATDYVETELLRAANRIIYDWYNNGWGVNNKTAELEFLQSHELFSNVSVEDLAYQNGDKHEAYMDDELATIIALVIDAEESNSLTPLDGDPLSEMGMDQRDWDYLSGDEDEDEEDDWYEDEEYDDEEFDESASSSSKHVRESGGYFGRNYFSSVQDVKNDLKKGWFDYETAEEICQKFGWDTSWIDDALAEDDDIQALYDYDF